MKNPKAVIDKPKISVIVTTYNWPEALYLVLEALERQDYPVFEIIIADDGSTKATKEVIEKFKQASHHPIHHVWQPDNGFMAASIRNKGIIKSSGDYIVFLDGDCIPQPTFLTKHAKLSEKGCFVTGNRMLLSKEFTKNIISNNTNINNYTTMEWVRLYINKSINRLTPLIHLPDSILRYINKNSWKGAITCNLGVWKNDIININGFDENYQGWGLEDSDFIVRLINSGIHRKEGRFATGIFHLWHQQETRKDMKKNFSMLTSTINSGKVISPNGIDKYADGI